MKKILALCVSSVLLFVLTACGGESMTGPADNSDVDVNANAEENTLENAEDTEAYILNIAALKGPTAMGLVELMKKSEDGAACTFTLAGSPDEITPGLLTGNLDIACVPANLAATLYQRTGGGLVNLAVNTLGVIYVVELGNTVQTMTDLAGKTIVASGKGSTPEYALRYLLQENGVDPDADITIDWKSEHSECVSALASGTATIAMLPQPFVTVAQSQLHDDLRIALDLTEEWDNLDTGSACITGVAVARREVIEEHPEAIDRFLENYQDSVKQVNADPAAASLLISEYGIIENPAVAEKALPYCNIVCITGSEMKDKLSGYLQVLSDANPAAVGGTVPGDDFYYGA